MPIDWGRRILLMSGIEPKGTGFFAGGDERPADDSERNLLVADSSLAQDLVDCVCLFSLPRHLLTSWGRLLEQAEQTGSVDRDGFNAFVADVARFLAFKDLPAPEGALFDLLVSAPGLRSVPWAGGPIGLACHSSFWGGINLGDEATALLLVNLPPEGLLAEVRRRRSEPFSPDTFGELAERFLSLCPDYSPVQLRIEPGEGFRLPAGGLIVDRCTLGKTEPDVLLRVQQKPGLTTDVCPKDVIG